MSVSGLQRVKERDEVDRCRHCGRPTWSLARRCVRCKRAGRSGPGTYSSLYCERFTASRILAFGCFWSAHVAAAVMLTGILAIGMGRPIHSGNVREFLLLGLLESTLDGFGFIVALLFSPRPAPELRPQFYVQAAFTGVICTVLTSIAVAGLPRAGSMPLELQLAVPVVLTAAVARICLSTSYNTRMLESGADRSPCSLCGTEPDAPDELFCRECGERRMS